MPFIRIAGESLATKQNNTKKMYPKKTTTRNNILQCAKGKLKGKWNRKRPKQKNPPKKS